MLKNYWKYKQQRDGSLIKLQIKVIFKKVCIFSKLVIRFGIEKSAIYK